MENQTYSIAEVVVNLVCEDDRIWDVVTPYAHFESTGLADVSLKVHSGNLPRGPNGSPTFNSGGIWRMYRTNDGWWIILENPIREQRPHRVASLTADLRKGDIYMARDPNLTSGKRAFPLIYPMGEVLMINLLGLGRGVLVHGCGIALDGERGLLFVGTSGAGKSTTANLWAGRPGVRVLSDDRVVIRKMNGQFWLYGTPFHGTARFASPLKAPLERIYFLHHGSANTLMKVGALEATSALLVRSFPPFWDGASMDFTLGLLAEMTQAVECAHLGFVPDWHVVDFVLGSLD